jgi:hypothetical protein
LLLAAAAFLGVLALHAQHAAGQSPEAASPPRQASSDVSQLIDTERRLGAFAIGGQMYAVVAREKSVSGARDAKFATTLAELQVRDANETVVYQESFPYDLQDGHFTRQLSASASVLQGVGGSLLLLRFLEEPAAGHAESWRVFGLVRGELAPFGVPLPLGQGSGIAVGGVLTGVMVRGGIAVTPLASTAELLEFRAWAGRFFVYVPVRVDWEQGQWSEAEQCFELAGGSLRPSGCNLRVSADARSRGDGSIVTLYAEPAEDPYNAQQVPVRGSSPVELLAARTVVNWQRSGQRIACTFDEMWLRVRIDGNEGWLHSEADLAALSLPVANPPQ